VTELIVVPDAEAAARRAAELIAGWLREALTARGQAHIALAGGTTPRRVFGLIGPLLDDWSAVHLWLGDERCVPLDDEESNWRLVRETLLADERVRHAITHPVAAADQGAEPAATQYAAELAAHVPLGDDGLPVLDVALQGIGEDGHTASLFPGHPEVARDDAIVLPVHDSPKPPPDRVTLSLPLLLASRHILLLATGAGKREPLAAVLAGPNPAVPASLLGKGSLSVLADEAAAPSSPPPGVTLR
jgi:6-phosphogluconolactonase